MRRLSFVLLALSLAGFTLAQDVLKEVYTRQHIPLKTPVPYENIREADVMWAKDVYRVIDLRQRQNLPLYYPLKPIGDRMNLVDLLLHGIENEGIRAFSSTDTRNEFTIPITVDDIDRLYDAGMDTMYIPDVVTGELKPQVVDNPRKTEQVKQILVKEKWFFDKNHSVMKVRVTGICPIRVYDQLGDDGLPTGVIFREPTFWVYFPEVRPILANHELYNQFNDAQRISYDDFFMQRRFDSYIIGQSNVYENRKVSSYALGRDALLESEKIKVWLFNMEHDLWEF